MHVNKTVYLKFKYQLCKPPILLVVWHWASLAARSTRFVYNYRCLVCLCVSEGHFITTALKSNSISIACALPCVYLYQKVISDTDWFFNTILFGNIAVIVFQCIWSNYGILRNFSENHKAAYLLAHPVFAIQRTGSEWLLGGNGCKSYCTLPRRLYGILQFCGRASERTGTDRENIVQLRLRSTVLCPAHIV